MNFNALCFLLRLGVFEILRQKHPLIILFVTAGFCLRVNLENIKTVGANKYLFAPSVFYKIKVIDLILFQVQKREPSSPIRLFPLI